MGIVDHSQLREDRGREVNTQSREDREKGGKIKKVGRGRRGSNKERRGQLFRKRARPSWESPTINTAGAMQRSRTERSFPGSLVYSCITTSTLRTLLLSVLSTFPNTTSILHLPLLGFLAPDFSRSPPLAVDFPYASPSGCGMPNRFPVG